MRQLNALDSHVEQPKHERGIEAGRPHDRRDAGALGGQHHELDVAQVEAGVLHVDEHGIEAGEPDDLDDLRIGDATRIGAERDAAVAHDAFDAVLLHGVRLRQPLMPSSLAAVAPSMATLSASLRPGVSRMWSTEVLVHGNG